MKRYLPLLFLPLFLHLGASLPDALADEPHSRGRSLHVKLLYNNNAQTKYRMRNEAAPQADGRFSVSGPCGGSNQFGAAGVAQIQNGGQIQLRINYNGGHRSNSNAFAVAFKCGRPAAQSELRLTTTNNVINTNTGPALTAQQCSQIGPTAGGTYPIPAPNGNQVTAGYTVQCTLPSQGSLAGDAKFCTVSVQDQRGWGGCVDLELQAASAPGGGGGGTGTPGSGSGSTTPGGGSSTPPNNQPPEPPLAVIGGSDIQNNGGGGPSTGPACCELTQAYFTARPSSTLNGANRVQVEGTASGSGCDPALQIPSNQISLSVTAQLAGAAGESSFSGTTDVSGNPITIGGQAFQLTLVNNELLFTNIATDTPKICDHKMALSVDGVTDSSANGGGGTLEIGIIALFIFLGVAACALIVAAYYFCSDRTPKGGDTATPAANPAAAAPVAVAMPATVSKLKPGWTEAQDQESGQTYYYNSQTKQTTWERHLVVA